MRSLTGLFCGVGLCAVALVGMRYDTASSAAWSASPVRTVADDVVPVEESMHEFMEYVFQPAYKRLKTAMATAPTDNAGWKAIKADSLTLAESCNLLPGRKPEENAADWVKHSVAARTQGAALYTAAKMKNFETATTAWKAMLDQCNACHKQFEEGRHILQP